MLAPVSARPDLPPSHDRSSAVCADLQDLEKALQKYAMDILPVVVGDPGPPGDSYVGQDLTDGVIVLAFNALQMALAHGAATARRQQRVM